MQLKPAPSKEAAVQFLYKTPGSTQTMVQSLLKRSILIGVGIAVFGDTQNLVRNSVGGSIVIELYLLWYYGQQIKALEGSGAEW